MLLLKQVALLHMLVIGDAVVHNVHETDAVASHLLQLHVDVCGQLLVVPLGGTVVRHVHPVVVGANVEKAGLLVAECELHLGLASGCVTGLLVQVHTSLQDVPSPVVIPLATVALWRSCR